MTRGLLQGPPYRHLPQARRHHPRGRPGGDHPVTVPIVDPAGGVIITGSLKLELADGRVDVDVPATDDPTLGEPFTYTVIVSMHHARWSTTGLALPASLGSYDLAQVPPALVVEYVTREALDVALADARANAVTVSDTAPAAGLWLDTSVEA